MLGRSLGTFGTGFFLHVLMLALATRPCCLDAEDPIFSGPQPGEAMAAFPVRALELKGERPANGVKLKDKSQDWRAAAGEKPVVLLVVHKLTRPALGLCRTITDYGSTIDGVFQGVVFLSDDVTETEQWMQRASRTLAQLKQKTNVGVSVDGLDGPGAYGLNRNVEMTVLVGLKGKVTANFALVQPSVQSDAPKIANALAKAAGVKPPDPKQLLASAGMRRDPGMRRDQVELRPILAPMLDKELDAEKVNELAKVVETKAAANRAVRDAIGQAASRIVEAGKLSNYGTPAAQKHLKRWAAQWRPAAKPKQPQGRPKQRKQRQPEPERERKSNDSSKPSGDERP